MGSGIDKRAADYADEVARILAGREPDAVRTLALLATVVPLAATAIELIVFVDQDGEGFLEVRASCLGPDIYVLNRAIEAHACLISTNGSNPNLPLMDPHEDTFVRDVLTDCAARWLQRVWSSTPGNAFRVPVHVISAEGSGTLLPLVLEV